MAKGGRGHGQEAGWRRAAQRAGQYPVGMQALDVNPGLAHGGSKQESVLNLRGMRTRGPRPPQEPYPARGILPLTWPRAPSLHTAPEEPWVSCTVVAV